MIQKIAEYFLIALRTLNKRQWFELQLYERPSTETVYMGEQKPAKTKSPIFVAYFWEEDVRYGSGASALCLFLSRAGSFSYSSQGTLERITRPVCQPPYIRMLTRVSARAVKPGKNWAHPLSLRPRRVHSVWRMSAEAVRDSQSYEYTQGCRCQDRSLVCFSVTLDG